MAQRGWRVFPPPPRVCEARRVINSPVATGLDGGIAAPMPGHPLNATLGMHPHALVPSCHNAMMAVGRKLKIQVRGSSAYQCRQVDAHWQSRTPLAPVSLPPQSRRTSIYIVRRTRVSVIGRHQYSIVTSQEHRVHKVEMRVKENGEQEEELVVSNLRPFSLKVHCHLSALRFPFPAWTHESARSFRGHVCTGSRLIKSDLAKCVISPLRHVCLSGE